MYRRRQGSKTTPRASDSDSVIPEETRKERESRELKTAGNTREWERKRERERKANTYTGYSTTIYS